MIDLLKSMFTPSGFIIFIIMAGAVSAFFPKTRRLSFSLFITAGLFYTVFSSGKIASILLSPLEYQYPMVNSALTRPDIKNIVILTGSAEDDKQIPLSSRLNTSSVYRTLEAHHLYKQCNCSIYISGNQEAVKVMSQTLFEFGIPEYKIFLDKKSPHTYNSAKNLKPLINNNAFFLVTSAGHMPRAIGTFNKLNMNAVPAPTDFQLPEDYERASLSPHPLHLHWSDLAAREYAGIAWYKLTDKI